MCAASTCLTRPLSCCHQAREQAAAVAARAEELEAALRAPGSANTALPAIAAFQDYAAKAARRRKVSGKSREEKLARRRARSGCFTRAFRTMIIWQRSVS